MSRGHSIERKIDLQGALNIKYLTEFRFLQNKSFFTIQFIYPDVPAHIFFTTAKFYLDMQQHYKKKHSRYFCY